jgi:hypothetical protein
MVFATSNGLELYVRCRALSLDLVGRLARLGDQAKHGDA